MSRPPANSSFELETQSRKPFLEGVLGRLRNDVGYYLECAQKHNRGTGEGIGYWGSVRLLMPVIEVIARAIPRFEQKPTAVLSEIGISTPYLVWILFRHSLIHNDLLQHGRYADIEASWGISMDGLGHIIKSQHISIDTATLYEDLCTLIQKEIDSAASDDTVEVTRGIIWTDPGRHIVDEFESIR